MRCGATPAPQACKPPAAARCGGWRWTRGPRRLRWRLALRRLWWARCGSTRRARARAPPPAPRSWRWPSAPRRPPRSPTWAASRPCCRPCACTPEQRRCRSAGAALSPLWLSMPTCARAPWAQAPSWPSAPRWARMPVLLAWRTAVWRAWWFWRWTKITSGAWPMPTPRRLLFRRCGSSPTARALRSVPRGCWPRWRPPSRAGSARLLRVR